MDKGKQPLDYVTLKLWYGGLFTRNEVGLVYKGKVFRTTAVDEDEFCWFTLLEEAEKCGSFNRNSDAIFWFIPDVGLQRVVDDIDVGGMYKYAAEHRVVECYLVSGNDLANLMHMLEVVRGIGNVDPVVNCPKKLTPKRKVESSKNKSVNGASLKGASSGKTTNEGPPSKDSIEYSKKSHQNKVGHIDSHTSIKQKEKKSRETLKEPSPQKPNTNPTKNIPSPRSSPEQPQPEQFFDFNDITISSYFASYEEEADLACLNADAELEDEDISEGKDPGYEPDLDEDISDSEVEAVEGEFEVAESEGEAGEGELDDFVVGEGFTEPQYDSDGNSEDEELKEARQKVKDWNSKVISIAKQLELQAASTLLPGQETLPTGEGSGIRKGDGNGNVSDYDNSGDEVDTPVESDEDPIPGRRRRSTVPVVNERSDFSKLRWCVGIRFPTREIFRECVKRYAIGQGRNLTFVVSDKSRGKRLGVKCKTGCPFKLYGSWDNSRACFVVKTANPTHNCQRRMESNRQLKSSWLAKQLLEVFKARPHWPAFEIIDTIRRAYKVMVKKGFAYKVKYFAHKLLHGSMRDHYSKIGSYMAVLQQQYPNSVFTLSTVPSNVSSVPVFQRLFICFDALKQGWLDGCRRLLCVDACFLKTFLGGQLLSATGRDENDQMFPLAWAIVEGENNDSYEWFFKELKKATGEDDGEGWTIISDEHQSIISMVAQEFPKAEHRRCARHIFANWHKSYKGDEMKMLFWNCALAYNQADFNEAIAALREIDPRAADAFMAANPTLFCRAFISTVTVNNVIVNNMAETFNAYIINARSKHLIYMLEDIRTMLMVRMATKKKEMLEIDAVICPNIQKKLEKEKEKAAYCTPLPSNPTLYQVKDGVDELNVDLVAMTCTCRKWDVTGIPCRHAIAAIFYIHDEAENFVHSSYTKETYLRAYNLSIAPCPGERHWPKVQMPMIPPPIKVGPGRPRKKIRRDPHEDPKKGGKLTKHGLEMTCSICRSKEHNKRTCPQKDRVVVPPPPKRGRGRPRSSNVGNREEGGTSETHHGATANPTRIGRSGRVIMAGRGGRGGMRGGRRGAANGGRRGGARGGRAPQGLGVLIDEQGQAFTNLPGSRTGPRSILYGEGSSQPTTQVSSNHI